MARFTYNRNAGNRTLDGFRYVRNTSPELVQIAKNLRREATPAERVLWESLRSRRLHGLKFRFQHPVETFILDFYCPACKLVVELDGGVHDDPDVAEHDALRSAWIEAHGYRVIRFRNEEVHQSLSSVLERIARTATPLQNPPIIGG